ncbi:MAG: flagellar assembly protein FliH [Campylobacterales bacterium]|nr:flagellar assembly protein FliH [Campylobacterales bacterium]
MATVISSDSLEKHAVNKYNFKVIALGTADDKKDDNESLPIEKHLQSNVEENFEEKPKESIDSSALSSSSKDSLIESLMQKTDEMSSNFIKLQMKFEAKEEEYQQALQAAKESAFTEGMEAGKAAALKDLQNSETNSVEQFANSVKKLNEAALTFESSLEGIKQELIFAALDISKEVIKIELSENSQEVAKLLSDELIKDLQGASKITLKVNPKDHGNISEHFAKLEHVDIISDRAVAAGGVIVISNAGNIDAQISKRFERVKKAALNE